VYATPVAPAEDAETDQDGLPSEPPVIEIEGVVAASTTVPDASVVICDVYEPGVVVFVSPVIWIEIGVLAAIAVPEKL
jgi:hypothetical protein